ncbi:MAG: class I SAM-dependent methyltransferase [Micrococcales bacterium]|nr:class I SAM-dependent methyltransferase [Actinomycetota bacterium]NCA07443.1 class I SAM-dependent methyltransferase [Micrococcales bacterium]
MAQRKPVGSITRGTTNPNRLRRVDRFIASLPIIRRTTSPIVIDLGYGATPTTAIEMLERLRKENINTKVVGIEIDRERVERAKPYETQNLLFGIGGFEVPLPKEITQDTVTVIRAMNVLRQYDETEVRAAWALMQSRLIPEGLIVEGTCDEIGRIASWVTLDVAGPKLFTISLRLRGLAKPSKVAERLPKALIHHNVPGEPIYQLLKDLDAAWANHAGLAIFSPAQRWVATCEDLKKQGWPINNEAKRWKLGELTISWEAVKPQVAQP